MRSKVHNLVLVVLAFAAIPKSPVAAESALDREYQVKAAFVYNFLKFVTGGRLPPLQRSAENKDDPNQPLVIGVLGRMPAKEAFEGLRDKRAEDLAISVRWFPGLGDLRDDHDVPPERHPLMDEIRQCHVVFICPSEKAFLPRLLPPICGDGILTIGDVPGFLETGGVINFVIDDKKVRFEINLAAAKRAKLSIRSSLLRLATRTIEHDQLEERDDAN